MIVIKILAPVIVILITLVQYYLDHKYSDRRSKKYRHTRVVFLIVIGAALIFSSITIYLDAVSSNELKERINSFRIFSEQSDSLANLREDNAKLERKNLEKQIDELNTQLTPFLELALKKYPNMKPYEALNQLHNEIREIRKQTSILQEKTDYIETRNTYKSLDSSLKNNMVLSLRTIRSMYPDIHLILVVENGNPLRQNIADEIKDILNQSGITNLEIRPTTTFFRGTPANCIIKARKVDESVAQIFFQPFIDNFFVNIPIGNIDDNLNKNSFVLHIVGNPIFERNGKVNF